jgi:hypothetical protein
MRTRPGWVEPEVWYRVVRVVGDGRHGAPAAAYLEQTVEITIGPKGAFESGNIGAPTRWPSWTSTRRFTRSGNPMMGQSPTFDVRPVVMRPSASAFGVKRLF